MDDDELASIVSYLRSRYHDLEPVNTSDVQQIRQMIESRTVLWTEEELIDFSSESENPVNTSEDVVLQVIHPTYFTTNSLKNI